MVTSRSHLNVLLGLLRAGGELIKRG